MSAATTPRLTRYLTAATAALGLSGTGLALTMASAPWGTAAAQSRPAAASAPVQSDPWPYFACVAVGNLGVCLGPPTS